MIDAAATRYALYFTPALGTTLDRFGAAVLGRDIYQDIYSDESPPPLPALADEAAALAAVTGEPRRYGFHATIKAPFRLAVGETEQDLLAAVADFCAVAPPVAVGPLAVMLLGGFVALTPVAPPPPLPLFAAECVALFDRFRAPLEAPERARRRRGGLSQRQSVLLERWGYPYVLDEFRLHLTLTGQLSTAQAECWRRRLSNAWADQGAGPLTIDALSVLREERQGEDFRLVDRIPMRG